jgi:hypothetical protein
MLKNFNWTKVGTIYQNSPRYSLVSVIHVYFMHLYKKEKNIFKSKCNKKRNFSQKFLKSCIYLSLEKKLNCKTVLFLNDLLVLFIRSLEAFF